MIRHRNAFSLLEVILALGLSLVIMSMIVTSLRLFMLQLDQRRNEIEQKQVARGVVRMFGSDMRAAIQYKAEDYAGLENLVASQSLAGLGAAGADVDPSSIDAEQLEQDILDQVAAGTGGTPAGGAEAQNSSAPGEDVEEVPEEEEEDLGRPTFIGTNGFVRMDTSHLPRLDEYNPLIAQRGSEDHLPSDIKSVTYFYSKLPPVRGTNTDPTFGQKGGLYRRQIDRAIEAHLSGDEDIGIVIQPDEYCELVAPEVASLQFRFWNGEEWMAEWDSNQEMGFPLAVELQLVIDPERESLEPVVDETRQLDVEIIRTVIHLPVAEIIEEEDDSEEEGLR